MTSMDWRQAAREEYLGLVKDMEEIPEKRQRAIALRALLEGTGMTGLPYVPVLPIFRFTENLRRWTEFDDEQLKTLAVQGKSHNEIAAHLNRSEMAVLTRASRLKISIKYRRNSPALVPA